MCDHVIIYDHTFSDNIIYNSTRLHFSGMCLGVLRILLYSPICKILDCMTTYLKYMHHLMICLRLLETPKDFQKSTIPT